MKNYTDKSRQKQGNFIHCIDVPKPYFDEQIIFEILSRIPGDLLYEKFRFVCKKWNDIISDPFFIHAHYLKSQPGPIFSKPGSLLSFSFLEMKGSDMEERVIKIGRDKRENFVWQITSSCKGFVLVVEEIEKYGPIIALYVINPATKQLLKLPNFKYWVRNSFFDLVFVPSTKEYKVVHICSGWMDPFTKESLQCEVLIISGGHSHDHEWRGIDVPSDEIIRRFAHHKGRICIDGILYSNVHWIDDSKTYIFSMDMSNEKSYWTQLPNRKLLNNVELLELGGFLACMDWTSYNYSRIDVWILKDFYQADWVKKYSITMLPNVKSWFLNCEIQFLMSSRNGEVIIFKNGMGNLLSYDVKSRDWKNIKIYTGHKDVKINQSNEKLKFSKRRELGYLRVLNSHVNSLFFINI